MRFCKNNKNRKIVFYILWHERHEEQSDFALIELIELVESIGLTDLIVDYTLWVYDHRYTMQ